MLQKQAQDLKDYDMIDYDDRSARLLTCGLLWRVRSDLILECAYA